MANYILTKLINDKLAH